MWVSGEDDIYNNIDVCRLLILEYIKSQGVLKNYHSFNYQTEENKFKLKENLTKSFFDKRDINVNA